MADRVLLIARGGALDGAERQLHYLAAGLDRKRFEPVVVLDRDGPLASHLNASDVEVHTLPLRPWRGIRGILHRRSDARALAALAARRSIRLVHASDLWKSAYAFFVADHLHVPSVVHIRGPLTPRDIQKHHLRKASAVIPIAHRYCQSLADGGIPIERICLVDDAVDIERFRPLAAKNSRLREQLGLGDQLVIGLVGRIEPFKRTLEFIQIAASIPPDPRVLFLIVGQPGERQYMRQVHDAVARYRLADRLRFTGRSDDMPNLLAGIDILVTLSGGSTMFEAMACGKPVLSVRTDANHSLHTRHHETALCVTTDRPKPAAEALRILISDPDLRQRLGSTARLWTEKNLSPILLIRRTQDLYSRLLGHPPVTAEVTTSPANVVCR